MKILIIRSHPSYLAVKDRTYNIQEIGLAKAITKKGHQCDIVFWTDKNPEDVIIPINEENKITVYYRNAISILKNAIYTDIDSLISEYDIIQVAEYNQFVSWYYAKKYPNKTVIYHGPYYSSFNKRYNLMCKFFDAFFLNTYKKLKTKFLVKSDLANKFLTDKGILPENVVTVSVGLDAETLNDRDSYIETDFSRKMKEDTNFKMLYIGRIEERRNIPFIMNLYHSLLEKKLPVSLFMIGTGDEDYVNQMNDYAMTLGINDKMNWIDKLQQKYLGDVYNNSDFFLLPTEYEIFGMVLLEAMYFKNVVLTTMNGGSNMLIEDGVNGYVLDKNEQKWVEKIEQLITQSNQINLVKEKAADTVSKYTWDELVDSFINEYQKVKEVR